MSESPCEITLFMALFVYVTCKDEKGSEIAPAAVGYSVSVSMAICKTSRSSVSIDKRVNTLKFKMELSNALNRRHSELAFLIGCEQFAYLRLNQLKFKIK